MDHMAGLGAFMQAAETRSFVAAGRQLGVSASAVGKAIARLEQRLGVRLFHRSTRSITLTPEGAMFLDRCRRIVCEIEAAELELSQRQGAPRGKLRVSLPLVGMLLMPAIGTFVRTYPEIELDLDFTDRLVDVIDEGFDAVIRTGEVSDSRLMTRVVGTFQQCLVAAPRYLKERGTPQTPKDLLNHACLHHKFPSTGKLERWPLHADGRPLDIELPATVVVSTIEPLLSLAEQGVGIACLPDFAVARQIEDETLVPLLQDHTENAGTFRLLWPSTRFASPKLTAFTEFIAKHLFEVAVRLPA
ncbi:LysR family transcriptional regulator [Rhodomicrobium vannielii ATCC 17100]|uniref:LysR substrate-binding domain-containing protein n=1 Tax=Rhodomicrobium vannielii TaxID=1069 RepID=UPI00191B1D86|nr:LysR substrate-binding domain-containing protein [Rhodomicrobium vannielii]MBJ7532714.1 LysR family transcriptional regulator [Rhodomicrobium vannielii ATCC 17100]